MNIKIKKKIPTDAYVLRFIPMIKKAKTDKAFASIINKIYEEGFEDGHNAED